MNSLNLHILVPNKDTTKYFGVDYFLNILNGNNPLAKFYSTSLDHNPVYKSGPISMHREMYDFLEIELSGKPCGSIIGIQTNPDIYEGVDSLKRLLALLDKYNMGLCLETASTKIIGDLPLLVDFANKHPLMIAVPVATVSSDSKLFAENLKLENSLKILQKVKEHKLLAGATIKPIIPFVNDSSKEFMEIIRNIISTGVDFIYPAFSIRFDSPKLKAFYDVIDQEFPELMIKMRDLYGMKFIWESPNIPDLKKNFVINCRKHKVGYAMKDIINLYKQDLNVQMKLF